MRPKLLAVGRAVLAGWAALFLIIYLFGPPVLKGFVLLSPAWYPTLELTFYCGILAAAGWLVGRLGSPRAVQLFALSIPLLNFDRPLPVNVLWLARLAVDAARDSRYLDAFASSLGTHVLLFGSLFAGAWWSRPHSPPPSIIPSGS